MNSPKQARFLASALASFLLLGLISSPSSAEANSPKKIVINKAGRVASTDTNTLLNGKGTPKASTGINGDFYIDTNTMNIYGPKTKGKWPTAVPLKGAAGTNGTNGTNGNTGATGATGAKGTATNGIDGATGPAGPSGSSGAGSSGPAGATGATGSTGAQGPIGNTGATGSGTTGSKGDTGNKGDTGSKGDTGTAGAAGSSDATLGALTFTTIIGTAPTTSIKEFGNFGRGKN